MAKQKTAPKPELVYEVEGAPAKVFLVADVAEGKWFVSEGKGWSGRFLAAGTFPESQARAVADDRYEVISLDAAIRSQLLGANPIVLQALAALGGR
jgi:hypothetical protein